MKKLLLFILIAICGNANAQIILLQNDLPAAGETWIEHSDPSSTVNLTPASATSQVWDYSNSFSNTTIDTINYLPLPQVFGNSYFPNADLGINYVTFGGADTLGDFFKISTSGLYLQGYYDSYTGISTGVSYDSNRVVIPTPFTYGSSRLVATKSVIYSHVPGYYDVRSVSTVLSYWICDAFGTLKTPANPLSPVDVIRIKYRRLSQTDSVFYDTTGTGVFYLDTVINYGMSIGISYQFFKQKNSCLSKMMEINYDSVGQYVDDARYYECSLTGIAENVNILNTLTISPNPTTGTIQLTFNTKHNAPLYCEIINVMGEKVFKSQIVNPKSQINLDVSFLVKGVYVVRVGDGERWENKKLVIE